jgi:branched-chain amino acid transport system substrate-binding protein
MQRRHLLQLFSGSATTLALPTRAQNRALVLGQSAAFSGPAAELGRQFKIGADLLFERLNARGGINGRTVELRILDDGYEPDRCAENTRKFIADGVLALFGYVGTPTSLAALPLATQAQVPFLAPFTGAQALREPFNRYAFHVRASYYDETAEMVKQLTAVDIKRIAVFHQNDSYGKAGLDGVLRAMAPLNLKPTATGTVERNTVDVAAAVKAIVASRPDAIVQVSAYKSCAGYRGTFYNVSFVGTAALAKELGEQAKGVVVSQVMPFPFAPKTALANEYLSAGRAKHAEKFEPNYSSMEGYVAAKVVAEALRRGSGAASGETLISGLEGLRDLWSTSVRPSAWARSLWI